MKKIILLVSGILILFNLYAQNFKTEVGDIKPYSRFSAMADGGAIGNKFYVINSELQNYSLNVYNVADMKLISSINFMGSQNSQKYGIPSFPTVLGVPFISN